MKAMKHIHTGGGGGGATGFPFPSTNFETSRSVS